VIINMKKNKIDKRLLSVLQHNNIQKAETLR